MTSCGLMNIVESFKAFWGDPGQQPARFSFFIFVCSKRYCDLRKLRCKITVAITFDKNTGRKCLHWASSVSYQIKIIPGSRGVADLPGSLMSYMWWHMPLAIFFFFFFFFKYFFILFFKTFFFFKQKTTNPKIINLINNSILVKESVYIKECLDRSLTWER